MLARPTSRGFTLIESMVVISIIVLLAAIMLPVLASAKKMAKRTRSISNMHQIHMAVLLYAEAEPYEGPLGLGLPPGLVAVKRAHNLPDDLFRTGGSGWKSPSGAALYTWMPPLLGTTENAPDLMGRWRAHMEKTGRNPVILIDETYTPEIGNFSTKMATGIYFDGHVEKRRTRGSLSRYKVWN